MQISDLDLNPLICDCNLKWMVKWIANRKKSVKGTCEEPFKLRDKKISSVNKKEMKCGEKLELNGRSFGPQGDQIAFKGDSYSFECNSSWIPGTQISWYKNDKPVTKDERISIDLKHDHDKRLLSSVLDIKQLAVKDGGHYSCHVTNKGGYRLYWTSHLSIIPSDAKFCRAVSTETERGTFHWHHTAAGGIAFLPCPVGVISSLLDQRSNEIMARRNCSIEGAWMPVEAQQCAHASEITRALYDLKQRTVNETTVESVSRNLLNISRRAKEYNDPLDVVYTADIVKKLAQVIGDEKLGGNLVSTISNMMDVHTSLLQEAQRKSKSCSSMVLRVGILATRFRLGVLKKLDVSFVSNNIAVHVVQTSHVETFGKKCYVTTDKNSRFQRIGCIPCEYNKLCAKQPVTDTSIYLPPTGFLKIQRGVKFQFIIYANSKLFPELTNSSGVQTSREVSSTVMSAQFEGIQLTNLSHPIIMEFKNHQSGEEPTPVYWDHGGNDGLGSWEKNADCNQVSSRGNYTITKCSQLSSRDYFAVMMTIKKPVVSATSEDDEWNAVPFSIEIVVFVGAGISVLLLLATLIAYALIRDLRYDRDDAAMLMNQCLALIVPIVVFVTGINHVTNVLVCRSVGIMLHYFLLSSLLWIGCSGVCLHRLIRTAVEPEEYNPVLRYYMISWGIPLIICGITTAGNLDNYNVEDYCWLRRHPFYGGFVGPACLIVLIDLFVFLRVYNLIKNAYETIGTPQNSQEPDADITAEENALVIQQEPLANPDGVGDNVDKSALPDKHEMLDQLRGSCVILLFIIVSVVGGVFMIRYQHSRTLYIVLSCVFALALIILGFLVFLFYCYRKEKSRLFWNKYCFKSQCLPKKDYQLQEESPQAGSSDETSSAKTAAETGNGAAVEFAGGEIHGAKNPLSQGNDDSQSNVSLPYSAVITIEKKNNVTAKETDALTDKAPSVSDKQSCISAPLPQPHKPRGRLLKHPPGHRHSYSENICLPPISQEGPRAPLAPPEGTASSVESSVQLPTDTASNAAPSECRSSVRDEQVCVEPVSRNANTSCSASEVSVPIEIPPMKRRPPVPGSSSQGSDVAPPLPSKRNRSPLPGIQAVPTSASDTQDLLTHYAIPEPTTSSIPRDIPRDHVVVRERYHIPYEPRALSEKPRDHYQILPLPTSRRDHYVLHPGHDQYQGPRGQHVGQNPHNQLQVSPDHYKIPEDQNVDPRTFNVNQIPSQTQGQNFFHLARDQSPAHKVHDLYQMARDLASSPRAYENYPVSQENVGQRSHDQPQRPLENSRIPLDPSKSPEPYEGPRDQPLVDRAYDHLPVPLDQNLAHSDSSQKAGEQNMARDNTYGPSPETVERTHDQYAGEGPREQPEALPSGENSTTADTRKDVPIDKNGVRSQNAPRGSRDKPNGIHVTRRRSRNPYQIARDIHHNLGIETRPSRRSNRAGAEQRSQSRTNYVKDVLSSPGETPKERTPRSSMSSWREERPKPAKKEWAPDMPKTAVFVPIPHLKPPAPDKPRNETSV
ncbi:putative G-protein coupled receptor 125 [Stylophora pistillata]|uniref:Putative G-protein coupled receptor 125 n=1 Tax=Stylophora pistillata TaxID=50429 RepID=A0A2B4SEU7_STYPI|nr:putative G-protein coupled receptor 125 [Stylophora pistillata]